MINFEKVAEEINRLEWGQTFRSVKTEQELVFWKRFFDSKKKLEIAKMIDEILEDCDGFPEAIPSALKEYFDEICLWWYKLSNK